MKRPPWLGLFTILGVGACDSGRIAVVGLAPTTLNQGLLAHYTFDEGSGTTAFDHSGNRHDGTIFGNGWTWIHDGEFGGALHLGGASNVGPNDSGAGDSEPSDAGLNDVGSSDATTNDPTTSDATSSDGTSDDPTTSDATSSDATSDATSDTTTNDGPSTDATSGDAGSSDASVPGDYVAVPSFPNAPSDFTVSAWIRTAEGPFYEYQTIASTELPFESGWEFNLVSPLDGGGLGAHFGFWDVTAWSYAYQESPGIRPSEWTHVTGVVDSSNMTLSLYIGDQMVGHKSMQHVISPGSATLYLSSWADAVIKNRPRFLVGDIDDVAIYGRALQAAEVQELGTHPPPDLL